MLPQKLKHPSICVALPFTNLRTTKHFIISTVTDKAKMERSLKIKAAKKSRSNDMAYAISATQRDREKEMDRPCRSKLWLCFFYYYNYNIIIFKGKSCMLSNLANFFSFSFYSNQTIKKKLFFSFCNSINPNNT